MLTADRPVALVSARLCEVRADGTSLLVTRGQLNLCHRDSHADPEPVVPGEEMAVTVAMDSISHRFEAGSRIRLSVSPCYWPLAWPSPQEVTLRVRFGSGAELRLPVRPPRPEDETMRQPDPPAEPEPLSVEQVRSSSGGGRSIRRDLTNGRSELVFDWDLGGIERLPNGIVYGDTSLAGYTIVEGDPLSARVEVSNTAVWGRDDREVRIRANGVMTATATHFIVSSTSRSTRARRGSRLAPWTHEFPRDHC